MTNKTFVRIKAVLNREIKITHFFGKANKKVIIVVAAVAIAALAVGALAAHWKIQQLNLSDSDESVVGIGRMMGKSNRIYPVPTFPADQNQFALPEDAAKSGELAVIVDNLDSARNGVAAVAAKNGGNVYATSISYTSNNVKNGTIVVQIPAENFDVAFSQLRTVGKQVIQESTTQIPQRNIYPYPLPMGVESAVPAGTATTDNSTSNTANDKRALRPAGTTSSTGSASSGSAVSAPAAITMPAYYPQTVQDKGYIKIVFADYGTKGAPFIANMTGVGYAGQNLRDNLWVVLGIKSILLIVLIVILIVIAKKILQNYRKTKGDKPKANVVRQMTKTRPRAVKVKNKKV